MRGARFDTQFSWQIQHQTNLMLNHSQSWYQDESYRCSISNSQTSKQQNSGVTVNHRLGNGDFLSLQSTHSSGKNGVGLDANWRTNISVKNNPVSLKLNAFDRPYSQSSASRNRGINFNLSFSLGSSSRSLIASLGSRNDNRGGHEAFASAGVNQIFDKK